MVRVYTTAPAHLIRKLLQLDLLKLGKLAAADLHVQLRLFVSGVGGRQWGRLHQGVEGAALDLLVPLNTTVVQVARDGDQRLDVGHLRHDALRRGVEQQPFDSRLYT